MKKHLQFILSSVAVFGLVAVTWSALQQDSSVSGFATPAFAQSGNGGGGNGGGGSGGGSGGGGSGGHGGGGHDGGSGGSSQSGDAGKGRPGTAGEDSDGKGPRAGQAGKGDSGGKPAWAQEGIPEVELGRLSVARSPDKVLDRALAEVVSGWNPALSSLYSMTAANFATYVVENWGTISIVDSPLQNLAMLDALFDGTLDLSALGVTPASTVDLAGILLGVASDKTVPISRDTVVALDTIMDLGLTDSQISSIAVKAEDVREAVLEAHG